MLQDSANAWKAFSASCWLWKCFPCKKILRCLKEVVVHWREVRWIWQMRQNFGAQFIQLLKCWLGDVWLGTVMEENWAHSVDQCRLQALHFLVPLIGLLSTLVIQWSRWNSETCSGSDWQQTTKQWPWTFFWCKFGFEKCFGTASWFSHWAGHHWLLYKIHFSSHVINRWRNGSLLLHTIREDNTSRWFFWFAVSSQDTHLSSSFTFPVCFTCQMTIE